jgi:hypothetical protein
MNIISEQKIKELKQDNDYIIYTWYAELYKWKKLTKEEYLIAKDQLPVIQKSTFISQECYLDDLTLISSLYTGRYGYDRFILQNNDIVECSRPTIKQSFAVNCGCKKSMPEDRKKLFLQIPFRNIYDKHVNYIADQYSDPVLKKTFKKNRLTGEVYDEAFSIQGIKDLPEPYCRSISSDLIDLILSEDITLLTFGYKNERPIINFRFNK